MKTNVTIFNFVDAFASMNRGNNFSHQGLQALYEYLEEVDENYELDVIALCCEFTEFGDLKEFQAAYDEEDYPDTESIQEVTTYIDIAGTSSFIVQDFATETKQVDDE